MDGAKTGIVWLFSHQENFPVMYPPGSTSDTVVPVFLPGGEDRLQRAANMMRALQEALDKVYDPEGDAQLRKLARDYCDLLPEAPCHHDCARATCLDATQDDCPLLQPCAVPGADDSSGAQ